MKYLYIITFILYIVSFFKNKDKTMKALKIAGKKFKNIAPAFIMMLVLISIALYFITDDIITKYLGDSNIWYSFTAAAAAGSLAAMPGFIVFPLCGILAEKGVLFMVISAFTTTGMMVGFVTFPLERSYVGVKVALIRNISSFCIAIIVAIITGIFFGEIL